MFTSVNHRSATAYQRVNVETAVSQATPHQLVGMLLDGFVQAVSMSKAAMLRGDVAAKGEQITKAVRIIDEGLKPALNMDRGGDIAANLNGLYGYLVLRLTEANLHNDEKALSDVIRVIEPIAQAWKQIGEKTTA